ncbi:MAG TPA: 50S ribosomal protein L11 methyltransferase [Stellaceae bacterium]|nr:50S ribosomal protein L11 methyltransferase [Stellaceae bacterium]
MIEARGIWRLCARVHGAAAAAAVLDLLDAGAGAVSIFESAAGEWLVEAYPAAPLLTPELAARLHLAAAAAGGALLATDEARLPLRDWLAENRLAFPPLSVGRFFIYGSHYQDRVPGGKIGIRVDAATAFGTGEHPSTRGCLLALADLARRQRFRDPLDIGTGTGILAIAAAKWLRRPVRASDIDAAAAAAARENVVKNGVAGFVRVRAAPGYRDRALKGRHYDLVLSNILARPLALMARDLARVLAPGGRAVLSGILARQERVVLAAHRGCGLALDRRYLIDGWSTLVLYRPGSLPTAGRAIGKRRGSPYGAHPTRSGR